MALPYLVQWWTYQYVGNCHERYFNFNVLISRIVDNLPCATQFKMMDSDQVQYEHGYKLGFVKDGKVKIQKN